MKKILVITLGALLLCALCACNPDNKTDTSSTETSSASGINFNDGTGNMDELPQIDIGSLGF